MTDDVTKFIRSSRAICDAATPGKWFWQSDDHLASDFEGMSSLLWLESLSYGYIVGIRCHEDNRAFIAHARTALPRALDIIDEQRREIERLREALSAFASGDDESVCSVACIRRAREALG